VDAKYHIPEVASIMGMHATIQVESTTRTGCKVPLQIFVARLVAYELPQLINVITGEMSIVGPRLHPIALNQTFAARLFPFSRRHNVKPGITGWAQVNVIAGRLTL
jgi:hypothetical protein